jgi:tRNA 2-thiocytidine biosynthesis protein TtcA
MKYTRNILKRIGRTVINQNLLAGNDKVLIALSGGKDSLILIEALAECRKNLPFPFELAAVHVLVEDIGYASNIGYLESPRAHSPSACRGVSASAVLLTMEAERA